ncbi:MAG: bifunctional diguanylate cyclase/phosphodiesterase [Candidatus Pacebacteria bacterium]|nr:bifunctional diguanylate cyclase/phosphodiesterase [Candidatus Paceibacterota bacterium]
MNHNISQGHALFDRDNRLVDFTDGWLSLLGLGGRAEPLTIGAEYHQILELRLEGCDALHSMGIESQQEMVAVNAKLNTVQTRLSPKGQEILLSRSFLQNGGFIESVEELKENSIDEYLQADSTHQWFNRDDLTDLPSRKGFVLLLDSFIQSALPAGSKVSLFFISLEEFNETIEITDHSLAGRIVARVAERLTSLSGSHSLVCRLFGSEFAILKTNLDSRDKEAVFAESLIRSFQSEALHVDGVFDVDLPISVGVARAPDDGSTAVKLMRSANLALTRARKNRSRPFHFFQPEMSEIAMRKSLIKLDLRTALERNELSIAYQPKVNLKTNRIIGMEALMRWEHPEFGFIPPSEFIPIAERAGLIAPMTEWLMASACKKARQWRDLGFKDLVVALNLSTTHFRSQSVIGNIADALEKSGLEPEQIEIEITEGALLYDDETINATFSWLKDIGIHISIDDFGVGYSSLTYLQKFAINSIKIDMSFISNMHLKSTDRAISRGIIKLAHSLGMTVVAEGVEREEHRQFLCEQQCDIGQGYLWSKPLNAIQFQAFLEQQKDQPFSYGG